MKTTIKSRILNKTFTFSKYPGGYYVYCNGDQICENGFLAGPTLAYYGNSEEQFRRVCQRWYRQHLKLERDYLENRYF